MRGVVFCALLITLVVAHRHATLSKRSSSFLRARPLPCDSQQQKPPHIIMLMADDVGVASVGYSARKGAAQVGSSTTFFEAQYPFFTPQIDALAASGVTLDRFYAYSECTPSRMSFLSGRLPVHTGVIMKQPNRWDGGFNQNSGYDGLNSNVTCFPAKLKKLGYKTHISGKMDGFGMATPDHLAVAPLRGFDSALGYFNHANNLNNYTIGPTSAGQAAPCSDNPYIADLFFNNNTIKSTPYYNCSGGPLKTCTFEEDVFTQRALDVINAHNPDEPLFLWFSSHQAHTPFQNPQSYLQRIKALCSNDAVDPTFRGQCNILERQGFLASVMQFDDNVGKILNALKSRGFYDNSLIVFMGDNGGGLGPGVGGNNFPLRGSKGSNFEGGLRVPALVSGGYVPANLRGTSFDKIAHIADWYATFCEIAGGTLCTGWGADPTGEAVPGIVPVESVSLWPYITGQKKGLPHDVLQLAPNALLRVDPASGHVYKLLTKVNGYNMLTSTNFPNCSVCRIPANITTTTTTTTTTTSSSTTSPSPSSCSSSTRPLPPCFPNATRGTCIYDASKLCCSDLEPHGECCYPGTRTTYANPLLPPPLALNCATGCLYDLDVDVTESNNLNTTLPQMHALMDAMLGTLNRTYYEPFRGCPVIDLMCSSSTTFYNSTYGPFLNVEGCNDCIHVTLQYLANPTFPQTNNPCQCNTCQDDCESEDACVWSQGKCNLNQGLTMQDFLEKHWDKFGSSNEGFDY